MKGKKKCPDCGEMVGCRVKVCKACEFVFGKKPVKNTKKAPKKPRSNLLNDLKNLSPEEIEQLREILGKSDEEVDKTEEDIIINNGARVSASNQSVQTIPGAPKKKTFTHTQPSNCGYEGRERPNLFFERGFDKMCKSDIKIDRLLAGNNVTEQKGTRQELVDVQCCVCQRVLAVHNSMVDSYSQFTCDNCQRTRHG